MSELKCFIQDSVKEVISNQRKESAKAALTYPKNWDPVLKGKEVVRIQSCLGFLLGRAPEKSSCSTHLRLNFSACCSSLPVIFLTDCIAQSLQFLLKPQIMLSLKKEPAMIFISTDFMFHLSLFQVSGPWEIQKFFSWVGTTQIKEGSKSRPRLMQPFTRLWCTLSLASAFSLLKSQMRKQRQTFGETMVPTLSLSASHSVCLYWQKPLHCVRVKEKPSF